MGMNMGGGQAVPDKFKAMVAASGVNPRAGPIYYTKPDKLRQPGAEIPSEDQIKEIVSQLKRDGKFKPVT